MKLENLTTPLQQKRLFDKTILDIDLLISIEQALGKEDVAKKLQEIRKTLKSLYRTSVKLNAALIAELVALASIIASDIISPEVHTRAGLFVYPAMFVVTFYITHLMDACDKKCKLLRTQLDNAKIKTL